MRRPAPTDDVVATVPSAVPIQVAARMMRGGRLVGGADSPRFGVGVGSASLGFTNAGILPGRRRGFKLTVGNEAAQTIS